MRTVLRAPVLLVLAACSVACSVASSEPPLAQAETALQIDEGSVGFDELTWAPGLHKLVVPAGGTGKVHLLDPSTHAWESVEGFSRSNALRGGHTQGPTSAAEADGFVVTIDRTSRRVVLFDPATHVIVGARELAATPDYVRYEPMAREVWITEPDAERIEVLSLDPKRGEQAFAPVAMIAVTDGPEALVFDHPRGRAYVNGWRGVTVVIDLASHAVRGAFANGCEGSRVLAIDEPRGLLFSACVEGKITTMDLLHGGQVTSRLAYGAGMDALAYDARRGLLHAPSGVTGTMATIEVGAQGELTLASEIATAKGASCAAVDDDGSVWICDPAHGRVLSTRKP
jgi:streptogramin lyase